MNVKKPSTTNEFLILLNELHSKGYLIGVIQFGSSIRSEKFNDIDIALIVKENKFENLIQNESKRLLILGDNYDISLILESEIEENFYFGNHGVHLAESLKEGTVLLGSNPFSSYNFNQDSIRKSVFSRLKDYIYMLRKSYFDKTISFDKDIRSEKFFKLALFLLDKNTNYPTVLETKVSSLPSLFLGIGVPFSGFNKKSIEDLWKEIRKEY